MHAMQLQDRKMLNIDLYCVKFFSILHLTEASKKKKGQKAIYQSNLPSQNTFCFALHVEYACGSAIAFDASV